MAYQITLRFVSFNGTWTENWFSNTVSSFGTIQAFITANAGNILNFRANGTVLVSCRIRDTLNPRNTDFKKIGAVAVNPLYPPNPITGAPNANGGPDLTQTAAPMVITAPNGQARILWVRGLPDQSTTRSYLNGLTQYGALGSALALYYSVISTSGGAIQHTTPPASSGVLAPQNVLSLGADPANPAWVIATLVGGSVVPAPGVLVYFSGFLNGTYLYMRGNFLVKSNTGANQFSVGATWREPTTSQTFTNLRVRRRLYTYDTMSGFTLGQLSAHKTANPTYGVRGRRSKQIRRQFPLAVA